MHRDNAFLTLTYDEENLPRDGSLDLTHWQKFAKRLRKQIGPFRFYHCGEYGDENKRPHYHAAMFGLDFHQDRQEVTQPGQTHRLYRSKTLDHLWGKGACRIGELTFESAAYVARYVMKKISPPHDDNSAEEYWEHYGRYDEETGDTWAVTPEYVTMSRKPGIGTTWFQKYKSDVYPSDEVVIKGRRFRPPRFYDLQLAEDELRELQIKRIQNLEGKRKDLTPDRLKTRERVQELRQREQPRNI